MTADVHLGRDLRACSSLVWTGRRETAAALSGELPCVLLWMHTREGDRDRLSYK